MIIRLHVLHLRRGIEERILLRGDGHVNLRKILRVCHVFIHAPCLHIQCLQRIEGGVRLFRSRIFLNRAAVSDYRIVVHMQVTEDHCAFERSLACQRRMGIGVEQLLISGNSSSLVVQLQLCPCGLIHAIIRIIGFRIALSQFAEHVDFLSVLMLQTQREAALEEGIVGSGGLELAHLRVISNRLGELTVVEIAVTDTVERIGIRRFGRQGCIYILRESLPRFVVFGLRESAVTVQIACDAVVSRAFGIGAGEEGNEVCFAVFVVTQTIVRLRAKVIRFRRIAVRLGGMAHHLRRPFDRLLHLALQEIIRA